MYKVKNNTVPSDAQARERLATYVYEYLLHVGANKSATMFLQEIGWDKSIQVGESPGFLHSWWCVFWDLYCASPEKRDNSEHSTEAKAFHDYSSTSAASNMNPMPPDGMGQPGMPPGYYSRDQEKIRPGSALVAKQPFMSPRYPPGAPRAGMQGPGGPQSMMQGMDQPRQGQMMGMNRMMHPRGMPSGSMNPYPSEFQQHYGGMRMPPSSMPGHGGMPITQMHPRSPWPNPSGPSGPSSVNPLTTSMLRSPQGHRHSLPPGSNPHRYPGSHDPKNPDSLNSEYAHMNKQMQHQAMPSSFPMAGSGPESMPSSTMPGAQAQGMPVSTPNMASGLNGINGAAPDPAMMDGIPKNSPGNNIPMNPMGPGGPAAMVPPGGPGGTPHTPQEADGDSFNIGFGENDQNDTAAILKIKESMQQDAKRFETKDAEGGPAPGNEFNFMP